MHVSICLCVRVQHEPAIYSVGMAQMPVWCACAVHVCMRVRVHVHMRVHVHVHVHVRVHVHVTVFPCACALWAHVLNKKATQLAARRVGAVLWQCDCYGCLTPFSVRHTAAGSAPSGSSALMVALMIALMVALMVAHLQAAAPCSAWCLLSLLTCLRVHAHRPIALHQTCRWLHGAPSRFAAR